MIQGTLVMPKRAVVRVPEKIEEDPGLDGGFGTA